MKRTGTLLLFSALIAFSSSAFGAVVIDFGSGATGQTGTYTFNADGTNATGTNIAVGIVTIVGTGATDGVYDTSGACASQVVGGDADGSACLSFDTAANTISIVGDVSGLGVPNTTLLTGSFSSFTADGDGLTARGPDTKSPLLLSALNLAPTTPFSFFGFTITTATVAPGGSTPVVSTDIRNTAVPEPSAVVLFGTMLVGCSALLRRRATTKS